MMVFEVGSYEVFCGPAAYPESGCACSLDSSGCSSAINPDPFCRDRLLNDPAAYQASDIGSSSDSFLRGTDS